MPQYSDDQRMSDDDYANRLAYLMQYYVLFCSIRWQVVPCPQAIENMLTYYRNSILPYMCQHVQSIDGSDSRIDRHKIIAGTQCAIMHLLPVRTRDNQHIQYMPGDEPADRSILYINACYAIHVGLSILNDWNGGNGFMQRNMSRHLSLIRENGAWLMSVKSTEFPIFLVAQFWYAIEEICKLQGNRLHAACDSAVISH